MSRVLVIDDSPTIVAFARRALGAAHEVRGLDVFVDMPQVLRKWDPDLVVLDLEMPGLTGVKHGEFIHRLATRFTPIVVFSSRPAEEIEAAANQIGAAEAIAKGISPDAFRNVVERVLQRFRVAAADERRAV